jgi:hypothetical protein
VAIAAIVLGAIVAAVTVAVDPLAVAVIAVVPPIVAIAAAIAVPCFAPDMLLEPLDAALVFLTLASVEAILSRTTQPIFKGSRFGAKSARLTLAQHVTAIEPVDLLLNLIDPDLKATNLAVIIIVAIAVVVAVAIVLIVLGGCGSRHGQGGSGKCRGNH